jgi:hypothetical protein
VSATRRKVGAARSKALPKRKPREGWAEAFDKAQTDGSDEARWPDGMANDFDAAEWKWEK